MTKRRLTWDQLPLFASDGEIGEALLGPVRAGEFKGIAALEEAHGFPTIDTVWGGRCKLAMEQYFKAEYGIADAKPKRPGGVERLGAWKKTA